MADTTSYAYDGLDRPSTVTFPDASTEAYSYDADSNVLTRKTRAGATIGFSYDTLNRLITKTPPSSPVVSYAYDIAGDLVGVSDTSSAIATPSASASFSQSATYDALNRPISLSWTPAATQTTPTATSASFTYGYDANNRRTSQTASDNSWLGYPAASAAVTSYIANSLNQYTAVGAVTPTYDGNGALTYDGQYTYAYTVESRLASVMIGASTVATYAYDAQLRRKSKTVGASTTVYVTDEADNGVLDYDAATGAVLHWYPAGSQVDVAAGTRATFITDIQGSVIGLLGSSGTLTKFGYQPFGENPNLTTDGYRYTGQALDAETAGSTAEPSGLYYLRARTYSPTWGRFLQPDPAKAGTNLYQYTGDSPLNAIDPSGLSWLSHFFDSFQSFWQNPVQAVENWAERELGAAVAASSGMSSAPRSPAASNSDGLASTGGVAASGSTLLAGVEITVDRTKVIPKTEPPKLLPQPSVQVVNLSDSEPTGGVTGGNSGGAPQGHSYQTPNNQVCARAMSQAEMAGLLSRFAVPGPGSAFPAPLSDGLHFASVDGLPGGFVISQFSNGGTQVVNTTTSAHFFVGQITRNIFVSGGGTFMHTYGTGNAGSSLLGQMRDELNQATGRAIFNSVDAQAAAYAHQHYPGC